jgi:hypothetical protein
VRSWWLINALSLRLNTHLNPLEADERISGKPIHNEIRFPEAEANMVKRNKRDLFAPRHFKIGHVLHAADSTV